jgi:hypothetical protein
MLEKIDVKESQNIKGRRHFAADEKIFPVVENNIKVILNDAFIICFSDGKA